jgi:hypothetical protein
MGNATSKFSSIKTKCHMPSYNSKYGEGIDCFAVRIWLTRAQNEEEARVCLTNAKGLVIDGRPIRVEHARAQRESSRSCLSISQRLL